MASLAMVVLAGVFAPISASEALAGASDWRAVVAGADRVEQGAAAWAVVKGSFQVTVAMAADPDLVCSYITPAAQGGRSAPRRQDVVYFFHTPEPGQRDILDNPLCLRLVSESGMTVFAIAFVHSSRTGDIFDPRQHERSYVYAQSGAFAAIVDAWGQLRTHLGISTTQFFLFGYSAGGIGVQHFAEEYPALCAGVVTANGSRFLQKHHAGCPFLIIHTVGDAGDRAGDGLAAYYRANGNCVTRVHLDPNWALRDQGDWFAYHALHPAATPLALRYLEGLADLRRTAPEDPVPPATAWPFAAAQEDPLLIAPIRGKEWQARFQSAKLTAQPLPSARFYRELMRLPPPPRRIELPQGGPALVGRPAPAEAPLGLLAVWHRPRDAGSQALVPVELEEAGTDLRYTSAHRFASFTAVQSSALGPAMRAAQAAIPRAAVLPVAAIVFSPGPEDLAAAMGLPGLRSLVVAMAPDAEVAAFLPLLQRSAASGTRLQVLIPCETRGQFFAILEQVDPVVRDALFLPFHPQGANLEISLHQQMLGAAVDFIEKSGVRP